MKALTRRSSARRSSPKRRRAHERLLILTRARPPPLSPIPILSLRFATSRTWPNLPDCTRSTLSDRSPQTNRRTKTRAQDNTFRGCARRANGLRIEESLLAANRTPPAGLLCIHGGLGQTNVSSGFVGNDLRRRNSYASRRVDRYMELRCAGRADCHTASATPSPRGSWAPPTEPSPPIRITPASPASGFCGSIGESS
jgi:hypothetical protein